MRTILIVGYDSEINTLLAMLAWPHRWAPRTFTATSTEEAIAIFEDVAIDGIIVYSKPDMLPNTLYERFLNHIRGKHALVVAASFDSDTNRRLVQLGCTHRVPNGDVSQAPSVLFAAMPPAPTRRRKTA